MTGRLENWVYDKNNNWLWGDVYEDEKGRFPDGLFIHTSWVMIPSEELKEGVEVPTYYSSYLLGRPREVAK